VSARILTPEILDFLEPTDARAVCSRRDLMRINVAMRQSAIMADALAGLPAPRRLADLGGGDGRFLLGVARRMARRWPGVHAVIVDRHDIVSHETRAGFAALGWHCDVVRGDIFEVLPRIQHDIVTANLFLHHLDEAALTRLLAAIAVHARAFVACEPRRGHFALLGARLVGMLGANDVTRHDAVVSVRAGFLGHDLSVLWPQGGHWRLQENSVLPFTHVFKAHAL
jgi:hypothetical protein